MSDPNQWIDPMGLQNQKNTKGGINDPKGLIADSEERARAQVKRDVEYHRDPYAESRKRIAKREKEAERKEKERIAKEKKARQNLSYNQQGLGRDRELDHIDRVSKSSKNLCMLRIDTAGVGLVVGPWATNATLNTNNYDLFYSPMSFSSAGTYKAIFGTGDFVKKTMTVMNTASFALNPIVGLVNSTSIGFSLGHMGNIPENRDRGEATSAFLNGQATTVSGSIPITPNKIVSLTGSITSSGDPIDFITGMPKIINGSSPYLFGAGLSLNGGKGADISISNSKQADPSKGAGKIAKDAGKWIDNTFGN